MSDTNITLLTGRLARDPDVRKTQLGIDVARFTLAVERPKRQGEEKAQADFIDCKAWNNTARYLAQYCHQGDKVLVEGTIKKDSYQKNGEMVYTTEVNVNRAQQLSKKRQKYNAPFDQAKGFDTGDKWVVDDESLPF